MTRPFRAGQGGDYFLRMPVSVMKREIEPDLYDM
jgi:hypothetical protein